MLESISCVENPSDEALNLGSQIVNIQLEEESEEENKEEDNSSCSENNENSNDYSEIEMESNKEIILSLILNQTNYYSPEFEE